MTSQLRHQYLQTNNLTLHVVEAGPANGPLVILLHGFPEFWYGWRYQIDFLAAAGYHVLAPDQRGYNLSDKPKGIGAYHLDLLAADVVGLINAAGREKAYLVGHDWGGAAAWWTAVKYPQRVERLAVLNCPHPIVMRQHLFRNKTQRRKSWYIFFFQMPYLPEWKIRWHNWEFAVKALQATSRVGTFNDADLELYRQAWSQPGAITAMLNWYRAIFKMLVKPIGCPRVTVPTLLIWGVKDRFLSREMAQPSIDLCDEGKLVFIEEAGHWVQHEESEKMNELLLEFLK
jgi:pimeloyl-ACP methyl ester carboxylesterase